MPNKQMKYQLVLQFPASKLSKKALDGLLQLEDELINLFGNQHQVDGHDFGSGEMNIFIHTDLPREAFEQAKMILSKKSFKNMKAAFRELRGDKYTVIWPEGYKGKFSII
jgi:hypothetical protein